MNEWHDHRLRMTIPLVLSILAMAPLIGSGQQSDLPEVLSASVPFYPRIPQHGHIEGIVRLRVSTDGARVSRVQVGKWSTDAGASCTRERQDLAIRSA